MDETSTPPKTDTVSDLDTALPPRKKSPPLAFEKSSNDSLYSPQFLIDTNKSTSTMGRLSSPPADEPELQMIIQQQATAMQLLHEAFEAERTSFYSERKALYQRIASLEKLLKNADGHSPAKSPVLSPFSTSSLTSPQSKATASSHRLPSIAEDEAVPTLSQRRENAPTSILLPETHPDSQHDELSVSFHADETPNSIKVEEIPCSPQPALSPPPLINRMAAGHTPIRAPRPLTPPPKNSLSMDGIEDTPTRDNTQMNTLITRSDDEDGDKELTGPLNMPELPNNPDESNFTLEALSKRLEQIEKNPEEGKPIVFAQPSPGLASPADEQPAGEAEANEDKSFSQDENPFAPASTVQVSSMSASELSSNLSPNAAVLSPLSKQASREHEEKLQADFESGGIKLKKRPSTNFGAPWGQLARAPSRDW